MCTIKVLLITKLTAVEVGIKSACEADTYICTRQLIKNTE